MKRVKLFFCWLCSLVTIHLTAVEIHVSSSGNDGANGTSSTPLRTLQKAVDRAQAGDRVIVHEGTYREAITVARKGNQGQPLILQAAPDERVIIDGTEIPEGVWRSETEGIRSIAVSGPVEQVFWNDDMLVEARWPNLSFPEGLWVRSSWAAADMGSDKGRMVDAQLLETCADWTGATAMLNISHQFWTWTCPVLQHGAGNEHFTYDISKVEGIKDATDFIRYEDDYYYLFGVKAALDAPGEWFYDPVEGRLYVIPPKGSKGGFESIRIKRRDYGLTLLNSAWVQVKGLDFFGCTFSIQNSQHCSFSDCHALFPSYSRHVLEREGSSTISTKVVGDNNRIERCSLRYASGNGLVVNGNGNTIDNNLIHDVCWSGSLDYGAIRVNGSRNTLSRNTVFNSGNVLISHHGRANVVELNHAYDGGRACNDVSLIYSVTPEAGDSVVRYNWVHGCHAPKIAMGIRTDDKSRDITIHHNVVWDCGWEGIVCKGDGHQVFHNTVFDCGRADILLFVGPEEDKPWQKHWKAVAEQNRNSMLYNNAVQFMYGNRQKTNVRPGGKQTGNYEARDLVHYLMDPGKFDFRPKSGSPLVDHGSALPASIADPNRSETLGLAPDAGAYELGAEPWIPGITWNP